MGDLVNLRRVKKQRAREAAAQAAAENRVRYGRNAAAKQADRLERRRSEAEAAGAKLDKPDAEH